MKKKLLSTFVIILAAIIYSVFLVSSSFSIGISIEKIEQKEVLEKTVSTPKLYIEGNISNMTKMNGERTVKVKYADDKNEFNKYATLKVQGNTSSYYTKKNYTIKFFNNEKLTDKFNVDFGWGKQHKYVIKANWVDKTHTRNIAAANIAAQAYQKYNLFTDTPNNSQIDGYPIEVYVNNEFHGLYTMNIPKDNWMMNMDKKNPNNLLLASEGWLPVNLMQEPVKGYIDWEIEVGEENQKTLDKFNRLITFLNTSTDEEFKKHVHEYLDVESTIIYYVMTQTFCFADNVGKNILMATYDGKVWYPVLYDLDTSFGLEADGRKSYKSDLILNFKINKLFERIEDNYPEEIANTYFNLRKDILSVKNITSTIDNFYQTIPEHLLEKENEKWGPNLPGHETAELKDWISERLPIIDKHMKEKFQIQHTKLRH